jgi:hypothetical protein
MNKSSKIEQIDTMYSAIGSALSNWTRVEIQLYQIFGAVHVLTIMQAGGGFSSDMRTPYAVLDTIDGFRLKISMIDSALISVLGDLDEEARSIISDWAKVAEKVKSQHNTCRNRLAHWTVESGFAEGSQVRLIPPPYSNRDHQGVSVADIRNWEIAFIASADRLVDIVSRLTSHQGLQRKLAMQTIEQVCIALPDKALLREFLRRELR